MRTFFGLLFAIAFGLTLCGWSFGWGYDWSPLTGSEPATWGLLCIVIGVPCGLVALLLLKPLLFDR